MNMGKKKKAYCALCGNMINVNPRGRMPNYCVLCRDKNRAAYKQEHSKKTYLVQKFTTYGLIGYIGKVLEEHQEIVRGKRK
jgi:hypothetical protein